MRTQRKTMLKSAVNSKKVIDKLHNYNELKDMCFELVGLLANALEMESKRVFTKYDIKNIEHIKDK